MTIHQGFRDIIFSVCMLSNPKTAKLSISTEKIKWKRKWCRCYNVKNCGKLSCADEHYLHFK